MKTNKKFNFAEEKKRMERTFFTKKAIEKSFKNMQKEDDYKELKSAIKNLAQL